MSYDEKLLREFIKQSIDGSRRIDEEYTTAAGSSEKGYGSRDIHKQDSYLQRWGGREAEGALLRFLGLPASVEHLFNSLFKCWFSIGLGAGIETRKWSTRRGSPGNQGTMASRLFNKRRDDIGGGAGGMCGLFPQLAGVGTSLAKSLMAMLLRTSSPSSQTSTSHGLAQKMSDTLFPFASKFLKKWLPKNVQIGVKSAPVPAVTPLIDDIITEGRMIICEAIDEGEDLFIESLWADLKGIENIYSAITSSQDIPTVVKLWNSVIGGEGEGMDELIELLRIPDEELSLQPGVDVKGKIRDDFINNAVRPFFIATVSGTRDSLLGLNISDEAKERIGNLFTSTLKNI